MGGVFHREERSRPKKNGFLRLVMSDGIVGSCMHFKHIFHISFVQERRS